MPQKSNKSLKRFLSEFFDQLNRANVLYLVERNYEQLPDYTSNDVDFLLRASDKDKFITIALSIIKKLHN